MNRSFLAIVQRIVNEQGESILTDPGRLKSHVIALAGNEPKEDRIAFGRAIEHGFYMELKNAAPASRSHVKTALLPRLQAITGFDAARCSAMINMIEALIPPPVNPVNTMFCNKCGARLPGGAMFCANCGANFGAPVNVPAAAPEPQRIILDHSVKKGQDVSASFGRAFGDTVGKKAGGCLWSVIVTVGIILFIVILFWILLG